LNEANTDIHYMMTGDARYDFVVTMVLHHQGVLDMAEGSFAAARTSSCGHAAVLLSSQGRRSPGE
jgi:uncharacterized protein (DUF305 family)